jgi:alpha-N-acetylglucosamine transferase
MTISKLVEQMDLAERVGRMHLQGKNPAQIAHALKVPRKEVTRALDDFRGLLRRSSESAVDVRDRLMDILFESDESFRMVIEEAWTTVSQADNNGNLSAKVNALKLVESSTKNRTEMLQKSGVSQDNEIIDQLNEMEEHQAILIELLKEISAGHPEVAELISRRLAKISETVEAVSVESVDEGVYEIGPAE